MTERKTERLLADAFHRLGSSGSKTICTVCCDMYEGYIEAVWEELPQARPSLTASMSPAIIIKRRITCAKEN